MIVLLSLVLVAGMAPLTAALARLKPDGAGSTSSPPLGSILLAALAFNLTFFWQELWLAIPKALTPGLSPVLYHNDHEWTGNSSIAELLQGTGAVATLASGLAFTSILVLCRRPSPTWQVFAFWMAFQGLFQSLTQFAIGAVIPGNDVGRALAWLGLGFPARAVLLATTLGALALAGCVLSALIPRSVAPGSVLGSRGSALALGTTGAALVLLSVPFRIPRNPVEVLVIPGIVNLIGMAWLLLGMTVVKRALNELEARPPGVAVPAAMLAALLVFFQTVLRPGIPI